MKTGCSGSLPGQPALIKRLSDVIDIQALSGNVIFI